MGNKTFIPCSKMANCVGCGICSQKCQHNAIKMEWKNGFKYPETDLNLCTSCGLCSKICPADNIVKNEYSRNIYGAYSIDEDIRKNSSSGGIFTVLAEEILKKGGAVAGCKMSDDLKNAEMSIITDITELPKLRGSKYVQAESANIFLKTKELLDQNIPVLFSGTPCYVAALKKILNKEYDNLITVDFICHGVPSPKLWQSYLKDMEEKYGPTKEIDFRNKSNGWSNYSIRIKFSNGKEYINQIAKDKYMRSFLSDLFLRDSCYQCKFKGDYSCSDIKLADFWGVEKVNKNENDNKGVSIVITNSKKGAILLNEVKDRLCIWETTFSDALISNPSYYENNDKSILKRYAVRDIEKYEFNELHEKYCSTKPIVRVKRKLARIVSKVLKV